MNRLKLFISYAHRDAALKEELTTHLAALRQANLIEQWSDADISAGAEWHKAVTENLESADIFLFLVSPDFLASKYAWGIEVKRAMERHTAGQARVIPIILRPAHWSAAHFSTLQALPRDAKPVTTWSDRDAAFEQITAALSEIIQMMTGHSWNRSTSQRIPTNPNTGDSFNDPVSGITFIWIPQGTFTMGREAAPDNLWKFLAAQLFTGDGSGFDEVPAHTVRITNGFWIGKYPVTQTEWQRVMGVNPSYFRGNDKPVESVSWEDIAEYLRNLTNRSEGGRYRLPTEAEWEYAARAGTTDPRLGYSPDEIGWWAGNAGAQTHPVGLKAGNRWGLHDVLGNVWEWCTDFYSPDYYANSPTDNPTGPRTGTAHVCRGGCWYVNEGRLRVTVRNYPAQLQPATDKIFGFRCVLEHLHRI